MKNRTIYIFCALSIIFLASFVMYKLNDRMAQYGDGKTRDYTLGLYKENREYVRAMELLNSGDYESAKAIFAAELAKETDNDKKGSIDLKLNVAELYSGQVKQGVTGLVAVYKNTNYPNITRAMALTEALQRYKATKDKYILTYISDQLDLKANDVSVAMYRANKKILDVYPTGIATAHVVRQDILNLAGKSTSSQMLANAIQVIENDIAVQSKGINSKALVPNIILAKAGLLFAAESYGLATSSQVMAEYERALAFAKDNNYLGTFQFISLSYLDYLGYKKAYDKADQVFPLVKESLSDPTLIKAATGSQGLMAYQGVVAYLSHNSEAKAYFQNKLKW